MTQVRFAPEVPDELAEVVGWYEGWGANSLKEYRPFFPSSETALVPSLGFKT